MRETYNAIARSFATALMQANTEGEISGIKSAIAITGAELLNANPDTFDTTRFMSAVRKSYGIQAANKIGLGR